MTINDNDHSNIAQRLAWLRFAIIGPLPAYPPKRGQLRYELEMLARRSWKHPTSGEPVTFDVSTIERWLYIARHQLRDPVAALRKTRRKDAGTHFSANGCDKCCMCNTTNIP